LTAVAVFSRPKVALSLTQADEQLLPYAALLARWLEWSEVDFAHVAAPGGRGEAWDPQPWEQQLRAEVQRLFGQPTPHCRPNFHVVQGSRIDQMIGLAVEHQRDLIVLGHRRMRSGRRSLARRLAMLAPCSVWLVPEGAPPKITSILVPIDFSSHSADSLAVAAAIARAGGLAQLRTVHVFFDPSTIRYDEHVEEILGREEAAFEKLLAGVDTQGVRVEPIFHESTHPAEAILRVAEQHGADLIVMNTRGRSHAAAVLLGSVTSQAIAATHIPLLAVKHYGGKLTLLQALLNHRLWETKSPKSN
jgi:nucleotide-binding universal stress UspA family protein